MLNLLSRFFFICFCFHSLCWAQVKLRGYVYDKENAEPLIQAMLMLKKQQKIAKTNAEGYFEILVDTTQPEKTLQVAYTGYKTLNYPIQKTNANKTLKFFLDTDEKILSAVEILPDNKENPAHILLRKIIANRRKYNLENVPQWQYDVYNKVLLSVSNVSEKFAKSKAMKPFAPFFSQLDTTADGKRYIPAFLSESYSTTYVQNNPAKKKEKVWAAKNSGLDNESVQQYFGNLYLELNFHQNFVRVLGSQFVSPLSEYGLGYYRYYLVDSTLEKGKKQYQVAYFPKLPQELTFQGRFWVEDSTYFVPKIKANMSPDANVNLIYSLSAEQKYQKLADTLYVIQSEDLQVHFNIAERKMIGLLGQKNTTYSDYVLNPNLSKDVFKGNVVDFGEKEDADTFLAEKRPQKLNVQENTVYHLKDTLRKVPQFRALESFVKTMATGYWDIGYLSLGHLWSMYGYNNIEKHRFRLALRTTKKLHPDFRIGGYLAYGTGDKTFKYAVENKMFFDKKKWEYVHAIYQYDLDRLGDVETELFGSPRLNYGSDIFSLLLARVNPKHFFMSNTFKVTYSRDWFQGFSTSIGLLRKVSKPLDFKLNVPVFDENGNADPFYDKVFLNSIRLFSVSVEAVYSHKARYIAGAYNRVRQELPYPTFSFRYEAGIPYLFGDYQFNKIQLSYEQLFFTGAVGKSYLRLESGHVFEALPYPLLFIHAGSEGYDFRYLSFNTMNFAEFISSSYISLVYEHNFQGFFLNKIPGIRYLKFREIIGVRAVYGFLAPENEKVLNLEKNSFTLDKKPFVEMNVGLDNILLFFRIDAVFRLTYLNHPNIQTIGVRASFSYTF
jgi:hypothetical protein